MNLGDTLSASFNQVVNDLVRALPAIIGALLILLIGYVLARVASGLVHTLLQRAGADRMFAQHGASVYGEAGGALLPSKLGSLIVFWVIMLIFLIAAANFLGWPQVSALMNGFVGWLPNLIVAVIIVVAAPIIGRILRRTIETGASQTGVGNGRLLGRIAEFAVIAFAIVVALNQVGIASDLVNILFIGVVAALALGFGLAFGLGGRQVAEQLTQDWYERSREAAARVQESQARADQSGSQPSQQSYQSQQQQQSVPMSDQMSDQMAGQTGGQTGGPPATGSSQRP